jgi:hypothetical protein
VEAGVGWAGVVWQFPVNNWGAMPGFAIPAGATKITFYVRGATGTERVQFFAGDGQTCFTPTQANPCIDTAGGSTQTLTLPTTWTAVSMNISGTYAGGVLKAFEWLAASTNQPAGKQSITFYIDDIQWQ